MSIIIGKLLFGGATIAAASVGSIFLHQYLNKDPETISISGSYYIVVQSGNSESLTPSPFKCQLSEEAESFPCKVDKLKWNADKKHLDYFSSSTDDVATALPKESNIVFKITVPKDKNESVKTQGKKLEIIFTKDRQKYTDAKLLFAVDAEGKTAEGKAEYFVAKAPSTVTSLATLTESEKYQCAWEKDPASNFKTCEIYDFAADGDEATSGSYDDLLFQKPIQKSNAIKANKHYLIKFKETATPKEPNLDKTKIVFIKKNAESETITFSGIKSSFLIEDKLLILGSQPQ